MLIIIIFLEIEASVLETLASSSSAMDTGESDSMEHAQPQPAANSNGPAGSDIGDRARAYIAKRKEEIVASVRAVFADRIATYDAIKSFNKRREEALDLDGGADRLSGHFGDFLSAGDGRMGMVQLLVNFSKKTCKTYSFDPETMLCSMCPDREHRLMGGSYVPGDMGGDRIVVFAGDQALPPGWASSSGGCPATIRIEYGSLRDIAEEVAAVTRGWRVPAGSIILLSSATQLLGAGLGHYMADFCSIASWLDGIFMGEVVILPGVPFLLEGTDAPLLIRSLFDLASWVAEQSGYIETVGEGFAKMKELLLQNMVGVAQLQYPARYWLADNAVQGEWAKRSPWYSNGDGALTNSVGHMAERDEQCLLNSILSGLQQHQNLEMALPLASSRSLVRINKPVHILVVGASNSAKLASAMEGMGITVGRVTSSNWKPSKENVDILAAYVRTSVEGERPTAVVFQMHDNLLYMGRSIDGTTRQHHKDKEGRFHVEGELVLAPKEVQLNLYKLMKPLVEAVGQRPFIIITPMRRYATSPCCENTGHVTNFRETNYDEKMESELEDVRKNMRSWLFSDNIRRAIVLGPGPLMAKMGPDCCWGEDPVHPLPVVYQELAKLVLSNMDRLESKGDTATSKANKSFGGGRDWRDRRGGHWNRGGRGRPDRGIRGRLSY